MFNFITISNGLVVVQHAPSGDVYRCRPIQPGLWTSLTLETVDAQVTADAYAQDVRVEALRFAERAAAIVLAAATEAESMPDSSRARSWSLRPMLHPES